jgi:hypothetical protein
MNDKRSWAAARGCACTADTAIRAQITGSETATAEGGRRADKSSHALFIRHEAAFSSNAKS